MTPTSDSILRPQWLEFYAETGPTEAFDVTCPPTDYRPVRQLGYCTFYIPFSCLGVRYYKSFAIAARRAFPEGLTRAKSYVQYL